MRRRKVPGGKYEYYGTGCHLGGDDSQMALRLDLK